MTRIEVVTSSGACADHVAQARTTSGARSRSHRSIPAYDVGDRVQPELDRGDHAEAATAAAQRPEQVRVLVRRRPARATPSAVTSSTAVRLFVGEAELAGVPAEAAAEGVADRRRRPVTSRAARRDRAGPRRRRRPATGRRPRPGPSGRRGRRCTEASSGGAHEHDVVQSSLGERGGAVAGALGRDPQPGGGRGSHDVDDVRDVARHGHGGRPLVDGDVPRHPGGVVAGVTGQVHGRRRTGRAGPRRGGGSRVWSRVVSTVMVLSFAFSGARDGPALVVVVVVVRWSAGGPGVEGHDLARARGARRPAGPWWPAPPRPRRSARSGCRARPARRRRRWCAR